MTFAPTGGLTSFVPTDIILPDDPDELRRILDDTLKKIVDALNDKEIAYYNTVANVNGQKWFTPGDATVFRYANRIVVDFGALPDTAAKSVAHGIDTTVNTQFTYINGCSTDPAATTTNRAIPIPYSDPNALANGIEIYVDATNVVITTAADYSAFVTTYVVLEFLQY